MRSKHQDDDDDDEVASHDSHNLPGIELIMAPSQYSTIPDEEANEATAGVVQMPTTTTSYRTPLIIVAALVFVVVGVSQMSSASAVPEPAAFSANIPLEGAGHARDCLFDECYATKCNAAFAPYTCLFHNGGPHGGCSPTPWLPETCDDQCDLTNCGDLPIPDTTDSCENVVCTKEWCKGDQICPQDVPYQCTDGSARFGCSTDVFQWTLKSDITTCVSCCDTTTCD